VHFVPLSEFDYHSRLAATPGVALVLFGSPDCGTCRAVERLLPAAAAGVVDSLFKVDVQEATALARAFDIFHLPALFLYRDGRFHAVLDTPISPEALSSTIAALLAAPAQEEP
jgi:thioredoxin-like negative regulator of GroEL